MDDGRDASANSDATCWLPCVSGGIDTHRFRKHRATLPGNQLGECTHKI